MQGQSAVMNQPDDLLQDRKKTWTSFTKLATYGTVAVVVLLAILALFLL